REVFTVTLNEDGTYTFELKDSIDHVDANGENVDTLSFGLVGTPDAEALSRMDFDQDVIDGLSGAQITQTFAVDVTDDVPEAVVDLSGVQQAESVSIDEDDLGDGTDGSDGLTASGNLGLGTGDLITIDYGADGPAAGAPTGLTAADLDYTIEGPAGLTSQGEAVTYSYDEGTDTLTATAGGREVFTVTLDGNGGYTFELKDSLDHADGADENALDLSFTVTGVPSAAALASTDYDADVIEGLAEAEVTQGFTVSVVDDVPVATVNQDAVGTADGVSVDEDDLGDGTDGSDSLSATGGLGLGTGDLISIDYGADGAADANAPTGLTASDLEYSFDLTSLPTDLTSNGDAITFTQQDGVLTATADAGGTNERPVFTVSIDAATGSYTFTLQDSLDHETANGENVEGLTFDIIGTPDAEALAEKDFDQDVIDGLADAQITQSFGVDIVDDVPVA
ncbi:hypothetical protein HH303_19900, partial [Rhodospirillaceae bacterium KN72]